MRAHNQQDTWMRKFIVPLHCGRCIVHLYSVIFVFVIARFPVNFVVAHTHTHTHSYSLAATLLDIIGRTHSNTNTSHLLHYNFSTPLDADTTAYCTFHSAFLMALNSRISNICASDVTSVFSFEFLDSIAFDGMSMSMSMSITQCTYTPTIQI